MRRTSGDGGQTGVWKLGLVLALIAGSRSSAGAQMPGAPVLQNVWATPGAVGAFNFGGGSDGEVYAAAASWAPASSRFALSGGFGARRITSIGSRSVYGVRLAIPFGGGPTSAVGFAAFVGVGGSTTGKAAVPDSAQSTSEVPLGAAIGWRKTLGSTHGISVYASPSYVLLSGGSKKSGLVRGAVGADVGITPALGLTLGVEFGQTRGRAVGGPSGTSYGVGLAYAFGRR